MPIAGEGCRLLIDDHHGEPDYNETIDELWKLKDTISTN